MPVGDVHVTGRLDRKLTGKEKARLAASKAGRVVLEKFRKYRPGAEATAKSVAKGVGSTAWELFKMTKAGKRIEKKAKKGRKRSRTRKGFHKECRWVRD